MNIEIIITLLFQGYIFLLFLAGLGWLLLNVCARLLYRRETKNHFSHGMCLIAGLILFVTFYSLLKTKGNSVFILNLIICFFLLLTASRSQRKVDQPAINASQNKGSRPVREFILKLTIFYLVLAVFVLVHIPAFEGKDWVAFPPSDNTWYVDIIEGLKKGGAENIQGQFVFFEHSEQFREPYHFFELWLSAGFSEITGISSFYTFLIIPLLMLGVLTMIVLTDIFKLFSNDRVWVWLVPLAIFLGPLKIGNFLDGVDMYHNLPFPVPKLQVFQLFFFMFFYLHLTSPKMAVLFILFLPVATFTALIPVGGAIFCLVIVDFWKDRKWRKIFVDLLPIILIFSFLLLFYLINQQLTPIKGNNGFNFSVNDFKGGLKTRGNIFVVASFFLILFFFPVVLLVFLLFRITAVRIKTFFDNNVIRLFLFTAAGCFAGFLSWLLLFRILDAPQLFQNFAITSIATFFTFLIIKLVSYLRFSFSLKSILPVGLFLLLIVFCFISTFNSNVYLHPLTPSQKISKEFLLAVDKKIDKKKSINLIATASPASVYVNMFNRNEKVYTPCFAFKKTNTSIIGLSITSDQALRISLGHIWDKSFEQLIRAAPFIKYLDTYSVGMYDTVAIDMYRIRFIKKQKIKYLVTARGYVMPANFGEYLTSDSVTDKYSGISFYVLDIE